MEGSKRNTLVVSVENEGCLLFSGSYYRDFILFQNQGLSNYCAWEEHML
jgi:hypothetical protein